MSLLTKIGQVVLKVIGIWTGIAPLVQPAIATSTTGTKVVDKLDQVFNTIVTVEQTFAAAGQQSGTGATKLQAATPFVAQLIQNVEMLSGKKPKNEKLFLDASTRLTSAVADILNSFEV